MKKKNNFWVVLPKKQIWLEVPKFPTKPVDAFEKCKLSELFEKTASKFEAETQKTNLVVQSFGESFLHPPKTMFLKKSTEPKKKVKLTEQNFFACLNSYLIVPFKSTSVYCFSFWGGELPQTFSHFFVFVPLQWVWCLFFLFRDCAEPLKVIFRF